jgi:Tfp pilus assembly protein PilV
MQRDNPVMQTRAVPGRGVRRAIVSGSLLVEVLVAVALVQCAMLAVVWAQHAGRQAIHSAHRRLHAALVAHAAAESLRAGMPRQVVHAQASRHAREALGATGTFSLTDTSCADIVVATVRWRDVPTPPPPAQGGDAAGRLAGASLRLPVVLPAQR